MVVFSTFLLHFDLDEPFDPSVASQGWKHGADWKAVQDGEGLAFPFIGQVVSAGARLLQRDSGRVIIRANEREARRFRSYACHVQDVHQRCAGPVRFILKDAWANEHIARLDFGHAAQVIVGQTERVVNFACHCKAIARQVNLLRPARHVKPGAPIQLCGRRRLGGTSRRDNRLQNASCWSGRYDSRC